jgi:uncharacterized protein Smg (DUF494 family)
VDFFEDDANADALPPSPRPRRQSDRRRTRIQRLAIVLVVLFVVIFLFAWWVRSCQQSRKVESYRTYMDAVATAIDDSAKLGKDLAKIVGDPAKYENGDALLADLDTLVAKQDEIATRAERQDHPDSLASQADEFATGMSVRAHGFLLFRKAIAAALDKKKSVKPGAIAALDGYLSGPDAYYQMLFYTPARRIMKDDGVSDVEVPTATYYLGTDILSVEQVTSILEGLGTSAKLGGIHGVALDGVTAQPSGTALVRNKSVPLPASPDLSFVVTVENQGSVAESDVPVEVVLVLPGGDRLKQTATVAAISPESKQTVEVQGFVIPNTAISRVSTLRVTVGPVAEERDPSNNSATYQFLLQLK